jgi:hypothetical protein
VLFSAFTVLPFDEMAARRCAHLKAELEERGEPLDDLNLQIASIALVYDLLLATNNTKHFERAKYLRIRGLEIALHMALIHEVREGAKKGSRSCIVDLMVMLLLRLARAKLIHLSTCDRGDGRNRITRHKFRYFCSTQLNFLQLVIVLIQPQKQIQV